MRAKRMTAGQSGVSKIGKSNMAIREPDLIEGSRAGQFGRRLVAARQVHGWHPNQEVQSGNPQERGREPHHQGNIERKAHIQPSVSADDTAGI